MATGYPEGAIEALQKQFGEVWTMGHGETAVVIRRPPRAEWKRYKSRIAGNTKELPDAQEDLAFACVVWPDRQGFDRMLDKYPDVAADVAKQIGKIASNEDTDAAKKALSG